MNPNYSAESDAFRAVVKTFLADNLPDGWKGIGGLEPEEIHDFLSQWRVKLAEARFLAPSWPVEYGGGGMSPLESVIIAEEFERVGAPTGGGNDAFSISMFGNTLLMWGTDEQKADFLPKIISGEYVFCQGYSEPDAGSDLAGLGCKAELDGDEWIINGQKIWTSSAQYANWIFVLCRTDQDVSKHKGISFLACPMDQPGLEIRPIAMLSGDTEFNETFFDEARTPKENVVGGVNNGWGVAMTLLGLERGEAAATMPLQFREEADKLMALAKKHGKADDPRIRQRLAQVHCEVEIMRYMGMRTLTNFLGGGHPGPQESTFKLYWSEYHKRMTELAVDILGAEAMTPTGSWRGRAFHGDWTGSPNTSTSWVGAFYNARAGTIYAGTSQVQRNIVGEMVLGLPKEPRV